MLIWYDDFFFPVVSVIEEVRVLRCFPGRTVADQEMAKTYRPASSIKSVVTKFSSKYGEKFHRKRL